MLRIQSAGGQEYLHVIEWQGYTDPFVLWRLAGYLAWLGQNGRAKTVVGTVMYLTPAADVGNSLRQTVDGRDLLVWEIPAVRLWELDAVDAAQRGNVGLAVLSPLMRGASVELVEQVVTQVLSHAPLVQQADLLSILGVFAEPLIDTERFVRLVGKEKLMSSDLITYLVDEKVAEVERRYAEAERRHAEELEQKLAAMLRTLQDAVEDTVILRFPNTPAVLVRKLRSVSDLEQLASLRRKVLEVPDQAAVEALLAAVPPVA